MRTRCTMQMPIPNGWGGKSSKERNTVLNESECVCGVVGQRKIRSRSQQREWWNAAEGARNDFRCAACLADARKMQYLF